MRPELALSDVFDTCAREAILITDNHDVTGPARALDLKRRFVGVLGEEMFYRWIVNPRTRAKKGERYDRGDVRLGGSIKSAPFWRDEIGRSDQNWHYTKPTHRTDQWAVFIVVEAGRDLGPANARQLKMAEKCLATRRWIVDGRWREPVGSIWGWQTIEMIERLPVRTSVDDGTERAVKEWRLVNWRYLLPWPEHPRPTSPDELFRILGLAPTEDERENSLKSMRESLFETEPRWQGD